MGRINGQTIRRLRLRRTYEARELARILDVHIGTVRTWCKSGLKPIDTKKFPRLYLGRDVRDFLNQKFKGAWTKMLPSEFLCFKCRSATTSEAKNISVEVTGKRMGKSDIQAIVSGLCKNCGTSCRRLSTVEKAAKAFNSREVLWLGENRLSGLQSSNLNIDSERTTEDGT